MPAEVEVPSRALSTQSSVAAVALVASLETRGLS